MVKPGQVFFVFCQNVIQDTACCGCRVYQRVNGQCLECLVIITGYGSFDGELFVGFYILLEPPDLERGVSDVYRMCAVCINDTVALDDGMVWQV